MDNVKRVKLAVFEAVDENLIDKDLSESMLNFCESADMQKEEDVKMLADITQTLINIKESVDATTEPTAEESVVEGASEEPVVENPTAEESVVESAIDEGFTRDEIALMIYESEKNGEITAEERAELFAKLDA